LPFIDWNRVLEAWVRLSPQPRLKEPGASRRIMVESQGWRKSIYGNARRTSVAGFVVPLTEETAVKTVKPWYVRLLQCGQGVYNKSEISFSAVIIEM